MTTSVPGAVMARLEGLIAEADGIGRSGNDAFYANSERFVPWRTAGKAFLERVLGPDDAYSRDFADAANTWYFDGVLQCKGILVNVKHDLEQGYLLKMSQLVAAELVADIWEQASELLGQGYKDAAASVAGAALESGLRRIALAHDVDVSQLRGVGPINGALAKAGIYNAMRQKQIDVWKDLRNAAAHGDYGKYTETDVRAMLAGVQALLGEYV